MAKQTDWALSRDVLSQPNMWISYRSFRNIFFVNNEVRLDWMIENNLKLENLGTLYPGLTESWRGKFHVLKKCWALCHYTGLLYSTVVYIYPAYRLNKIVSYTPPPSKQVNSLHNNCGGEGGGGMGRGGGWGGGRMGRMYHGRRQIIEQASR